MRPGDLVRIRRTAGTQMFFPEIVGKVGVLISDEDIDRSSAVEVLVGEQIMLLACGYLVDPV